MQLAELVKDWPCKVKGSVRIEVTNIAERWQNVTDGGLFFAHNGRNVDGNDYIEHALENGAVVIVTEDETLFEHWAYKEALVWVPNSRTFCAYVSHRFYGEPSEVLPIIAITGTNGKTTVSHLIGQIAKNLGVKTLVIGTNGIFLDGELQEENEPLTTKSAIFLQRLLQQAIRQQVELVVLEASSMGLEQHRLDYCAVDVGVFLNLSQEHIEDHRTLENYKTAKRRLVQLSDQIVCNADDGFCHAVAAKCTKPVMLYSTTGQGDLSLQLLHEDLQHSLVKVTLSHYQEVSALSIAGNYTHSNISAAISALCMLGVDIAEIVPVLPKLTLPDGRMQLVAQHNGAHVYIDYAHTPVAFKHVLQHIERYCHGKLIVVFGCGGERDKAKRQEIGRIASKYADIIILTTDNCRSENPAAINAQIRNGFFATQQYEEWLERKEAIGRALQLAEEDDIVLIAGKGHETVQIIGNTVQPFNDIEIVQELVTVFNEEN